MVILCRKGKSRANASVLLSFFVFREMHVVENIDSCFDSFDLETGVPATQVDIVLFMLQTGAAVVKRPAGSVSLRLR